MLFQCISGRHYWTRQDDAAKCCNGYTRILVIGGGANQQDAGGIRCGRAWMSRNDLDNDRQADNQQTGQIDKKRSIV